MEDPGYPYDPRSGPYRNGLLAGGPMPGGMLGAVMSQPGILQQLANPPTLAQIRAGSADISAPMGLMMGMTSPTPNLPMDASSILTRAIEGGWSRPRWYHATNADISAFDLAKIRRGNPLYPGEHGIWTSSAPEVAQAFAVGDNVNIMPLRLRLGRSADIPWEPSFRGHEIAGLLSDLRAAGYDSAVFRGYRDTGRNGLITPSSDAAVVFDPVNIRSIFAAFDPAARGSADLLRGLAPLGPLGALPWMGGADVVER